MKLLSAFLAAVLCVLTHGAWAQSVQKPILIPPTLSGIGTMATSNASQTISSANVTATGASGGFPSGTTPTLPTGYLTVKLQGNSTTNVAVCWLGGTCTFATGEVLLPGESATTNIATTFASSPPTVIAASGTPVILVKW